MKILPAYNVQIWCGLKEDYDGPVHSIDEAYRVCSEFVNSTKDCVTVTPTKFVYVNGEEDGFIVGWITYPRFPREHSEILDRAKQLGKLLLLKFKQNRLTITTPKNSIMLEIEEDMLDEL